MRKSPKITSGEDKGDNSPLKSSVQNNEHTACTLLETQLPESIINNLLTQDETLIPPLANKNLNRHPYSQLEVDSLLLHIARGEQDLVEKIIKEKPGLLLQKGRVTDIGGRTFEKITAFQLAVWGLDKHMWELLLMYFSKIAAREQLEELEKTPTYTVSWLPENQIIAPDKIPAENELIENTIYVKKIQQEHISSVITPALHYIVKTQDGKISENVISESELGLSIEKNELNNLLPSILKVTTKRKHTLGHGARFDEKPLLAAYEFYQTRFKISPDDSEHNSLQEFLYVIGKHQRMLPVAALNEFCRRDRSKGYQSPPAFNDTILPRELNALNNTAFLPLQTFSGLGFDFILLRGCHDELQLKNICCDCNEDLVALTHLYEVRNADLDKLRQELNLIAKLGS